ncbi:MAG TPA: hypothetical protein VE267_20920 [Bradyrhizobium sp.]|nr:hypothetical protein [Bradyrhizobium sp.]
MSLVHESDAFHSARLLRGKLDDLDLAQSGLRVDPRGFKSIRTEKIAAIGEAPMRIGAAISVASTMEKSVTCP